ncbi:MAG: PD-(D/E)XK nuclease family protein [Bryobacteraceae bacterium]
MNGVSPPAELAQVLSPSQVRCFMDCQARWWFKHSLRYPDPPSGNMALGRAVHTALAENFAQKIESYEDLPIAGVLALFRQAWAFEREQAEFRDDEDPAELASCGEILVAKYLDRVAPWIEPVGVELHVVGEIAGVRVQGWVDLLDVSGRIIDIKTSARKPSGIDPQYRFQIATYAQLTHGASGEARIDTLVKTKTPALVPQSFTVNEQDLLETRELYPLAQRVMRSELYLPNRLSLSCSRRNCSYWRNCEREWGGEVPET